MVFHVSLFEAEMDDLPYIYYSDCDCDSDWLDLVVCLLLLNYFQLYYLQ